MYICIYIVTLPSRARPPSSSLIASGEKITRTVPQSPERRIVIVFKFESYRILFYFFLWYERLSTEAIEAEEQLRHRSRREAMEDVGERERERERARIESGERGT